MVRHLYDLLPTVLCCAGFSFGCSHSEDPDPLDSAPHSHVIVISIDTLRADHMSCYDYFRESSPHIDALAEQSVLFEKVYSHSNNTGPSHMTMLSGVLPYVHGVEHKQENSLAPGAPYLPEILSNLGYKTAAFADGGYVSSPFGFARGFDSFHSKYESFNRKLDRVEGWLERATDEPTFLFLHTYMVHAPYLPSKEHDLFTDDAYDGELRSTVERLRTQRAMLEANLPEFGDKMKDLRDIQRLFWTDLDKSNEEDMEYLKGLYDGCIHEVDAGIGRLLSMLDEKGWLDNAWLVLTSDHGEAFKEHGSVGHRQLYNEELHVPLLIRPPGGLVEGQRVDTVVGLAAIPPTILYALGSPVPNTMQDSSLLPLSELKGRAIHATLGENRLHQAYVRAGSKLIVKGEKAAELYNLEVDPRERENLLDQVERPAVADKLMTAWKQVMADCVELREIVGDPARATAFDEEQLQALRELGYLGDDN